jgi:hypothetical protein
MSSAADGSSAGLGRRLRVDVPQGIESRLANVLVLVVQQADRLGWVVALDVGAAVAVAAGLLGLWISPGGAANRQTGATGGKPLP